MHLNKKWRKICIDKKHKYYAMQAKLSAYTDIIHEVLGFYQVLELDRFENHRGRKLALAIPEILALGIFKQRYSIETKKSVYEICQLKCSYKTYVVNVNRFAPLAGLILSLILWLNRLLAHPIKYTDSTDIPVCQGQHAKTHKTMKFYASWAGTSTGTFFGLKLHITTDFQQRLLRVYLATGKLDERDVFPIINTGLEGIFVLDAGYIRAKLQDTFRRSGRRIMLVAPRKNMKKLMTKFQHWILNGRMKIELNFRSLKLFFGLVTSLPRSVDGYLANYTYALLAYCLT